MTESRSKADRSETRVQVVPTEIRGIITGTGVQQPFLVWDVSERGIGIWASEGLVEGSEIVLTIGQPYLLVINCIVKWCESQSDGRGYRCGLKSIDKEKSFETLLEAFLKTKKK
ncbi:MAG: PilZ domain-containing protein [Oligoflexales bacterium]